MKQRKYNNIGGEIKWVMERFWVDNKMDGGTYEVENI